MNKKKFAKPAVATNAIPALRKELIAALPEVVVENYMPGIWHDRFDRIRDLISTHYGAWLSVSDINGLIIDNLFSSLNEVHALTHAQITVSDHLSAEQISAIAERIIAVIRTLPRSYEVLFPLHKKALW